MSIKSPMNWNFIHDENRNMRVSYRLKNLVSPSGMVETPHLQAKRKNAKCEHSKHEPPLEMNRIILSHPRKRVSRILFFLILFLDSCFRRNDNETRSGIKVDLKSTLFRNPSPSRRGRVQLMFLYELVNF